MKGTIKVNGFVKVKDSETLICKAGDFLFAPVKTFNHAYWAVCFLEQKNNPNFRIVKDGNRFHIMDITEALDVSRGQVIRKR